MSTSVRSMTGFARARRPLGEGEVVVSVKSVNHRGLDIHVRAPASTDPFEVAIRALVKSHVTRGHVEIRISIPGPNAENNAPALNHGLLNQYLKAFREAAAAHSLATSPDLNAAFRFPGILASAETAELLEGT